MSYHAFDPNLHLELIYLRKDKNKIMNQINQKIHQFYYYHFSYYFRGLFGVKGQKVNAPADTTDVEVKDTATTTPVDTTNPSAEFDKLTGKLRTFGTNQLNQRATRSLCQITKKTVVARNFESLLQLLEEVYKK